MKLNKKQTQKTQGNGLKKIIIPLVLLIAIAATVTFAQQNQNLIQHAASNVICTTRLSDTDQKHFDSVVANTMRNNQIPGLSIAISKNGSLVYAKGYGFSELSKNTTVNTSTRFRIASLSKPITSTGIMLLVQSGRLNLDSKVFGPGSLLGTAYTSRPRDARVNNITVRQLLSHTSGLPTNDGNDPMGKNLSYSQAQLIKWTLENYSLASAPGTKYAYSNFGYLVLGRVIEKVTQQRYDTWIKANVLAPSGITSMQIAGNTYAQRASNEAVYYVIANTGAGEPYGMNVTRMDAHGGWIATPTDLVRFINRMDGAAPPPDLLTPAAQKLATTPTTQSGNTYGFGWSINPNSWWHSGALQGSSSILVRKSYGYNWAVLTNMRDAQNKSVGAIDAMVYDAMNGITSWPTCN